MSRLRPLLKVKNEADREKVDKRIDEIAKDERWVGYHPPRTAAEWWQTMYVWWPEIVSLWRQFSNRASMPTEDELCKMRKERNLVLERYCHRVWNNAPDSGHIHALPGWHVLCDLCSEAWTLRQGEVVPSEEKAMQ